MEQLHASLLKEDAHQISESRSRAAQISSQLPIIVSDRQLLTTSINTVLATSNPSTKIERLDRYYPTSPPVQDARWSTPKFWTIGPDHEPLYGPLKSRDGRRSS